MKHHGFMPKRSNTIMTPHSAVAPLLRFRRHWFCPSVMSAQQLPSGGRHISEWSSLGWSHAGMAECWTRRRRHGAGGGNEED
jgi:hypothetical protein